MRSDGLIVRPARREDRDAWLRVWEESAGAGFLPLLPPGAELPPVEPGLWDELLAMPGLTLLMAEEDGEVTGYTGCGSSRDDDTPPEVGEIRSLFVSPERWRSGVGRALTSAALDELRKLGHTEAIVWSFAGNDRASAFYERMGFERDGAERIEERFAGIPSVRYRRSL